MKKCIDLIEKKKDFFLDHESLQDFINSYANSDDELQDIQKLDDYIIEYADGLVPIYYSEIVKEWTENGNARGLAIDVFGEYQGNDIYNMMQQDLLCYYEQDLKEDFQTLINFIEELEEEEEA